MYCYAVAYMAEYLIVGSTPAAPIMPTVLNGAVLTSTGSVHDIVLSTSPPEMGKRTKASRACDECRRKKIRCDIGEGSICSSCNRVGTMCTFSRIQLKRGPSKRQRSQSDAPAPKQPLPGINALLNWTPQSKLRIPLSPSMAASPPYHPYRRPSLPATASSPFSTSPIYPELNPTALNYYYTNFHSVLPILPDSPSELQILLRDASNCQCLIGAINGTATSVPIEPAYGAARITQLMALIMVYCATIEPTWLGAAAANAMALSRDTVLTRRLYFTVAILDRLHAAVFGTNHMLALETEVPVGELARIYLWGDSKKGSITPPPDTINEVSALAMQCIMVCDRAKLEAIAPKLKETPLSTLISRALGNSPVLIPVTST